MPAKALELFGMAYRVEYAFLGYIIAWFCLLVSVLVGYIIYLFWQNNSNYAPLTYLLASWWVGLGIGIFVMYGKVDNLVLDTMKGAVIIMFTYINQTKHDDGK